MTRRWLTGPVALATLVMAPAGAGAQPAGPPIVGGDFAPDTLDELAVDEHLGAALPLDLAFRDGAGRPVRLGSLFGDGKPVLLILAYFRCPMLCSLVVSGATHALRETGWTLGDQYRAVTISFDPEDTAAEAARKQETVLAEVGQPDRPAAWPFLVGAAPEIRALTARLGFPYRYDARSNQFAHPAVIFALTPDGKVARYLYGVEPPARDVKLALLEASAGRTGSAADKILMLCYRWDPATRRYGPFAQSFMRTGALLVFLGFAAVMGLLWRRELAARRAGPRDEAGA